MAETTDLTATPVLVTDTQQFRLMTLYRLADLGKHIEQVALAAAVRTAKGSRIPKHTEQRALDCFGELDNCRSYLGQIGWRDNQ